MTAYQPADFAIPSGFQHYAGDNAEDYLGPFFYRVQKDEGGEMFLEGAFRVKAHHCNMGGSTHGGVLMSFADYCLCMPVFLHHSPGVVTVSCNSEFIGSSCEGDLIMGRAELTRQGKSLAFTRCTLSVDDRPILTASGIIKLLEPR